MEIYELGWHVHVLCKRAAKQTEADEHARDVLEAQTYLNMMQNRVDKEKRRSFGAPPLVKIRPDDSEPEPAAGPIRDDDGNIICISSQPGEPGYDKELSMREGVEIWCDGAKVEVAHTADVRAGIVKYYQKDERGRIKTLEKRGKVEIRGL